jgi:hypothetical protein
MIEHIFIILFLVMLIWHSYGENEIFEWLANILKRFPEKMHKPLLDCSVCMSPWYGTLIGIGLWGWHWHRIVEAIAAGGVAAIVVRLWPEK